MGAPRALSIVPDQFDLADPQRGRQLVEGDHRRVALAAFEVADELLAEAAFPGERLLGQAGRVAQPRGEPRIWRL
jgi:hypothetical protein